MNVNIDYFGILKLLQQLVVKGVCTYLEAKRIAVSIAMDLGVDTIFACDFVHYCE